MLWKLISYIYLFNLVTSIMAVRSTGPLLCRLRDLMKLKYLGEPIQGYIVLSEDAHQVILFIIMKLNVQKLFSNYL